MITVIEDIASLVKNDTYYFINDYYEYVKEYKHIQDTIQQREDLTLVVRIRVIRTWLEKLSARYEDHIFKFEQITYRTNLQSQWGINIPIEYDPDDLEKLDLMNLDIFPKTTDDFEDFILSYFYDPLLSNHIFNPNMIVHYLKAFDKRKWEENYKSDLLRKVYEKRVKEWKKKIKDDSFLSILNELLLNPGKINIELMNYKVLRTKLYNEIGRLVLRDRFDVYNKLNINLKDLELHFDKLQETIKQIEIQLNVQKTPINEKELEKIISQLSGLLPSEFYYLENILRESPEFVSQTVIGLIKTIFSPIYSLIGKKIEKLSDLIVPPKPEKMDKSWELNQVKDWLIRKYIPYYDWLLRNNKHDVDFLFIGDSFSEWLYENWEDIKSNSKSLVSNWLYNNSSSFTKPDKYNIILIIDNLSWSHSELLQGLFYEKDLQKILIEPYFSMIPSETETSKKCLLSGKTNYTEIDHKNYSDILSKGWVPYFESPNFIYVTSLDEFEDLTLEKGKSYFVNYHSIDVALHQDKAKLGLTHDKQVKNLLTDLTERISSYLTEKNLISESIIHIISDHGSTKLHPDTTNDIDVKSFKKRDTKKISDRFVFLSDEEFASLPDNLKYDMFFLDKNRFGLPYSCLSARRGNTFKDYTYNSYVHGGVLPEEVVIPHLIFEKVEIKINDPIITLLENTFRYKLEEIEVQIENPNDEPLENIQIRILNSNVESLPKLIEWINTKSKDTIKFQSRIKKPSNPDGQNYLFIQLNYFANGKPHQIDLKKDIKMVSTVELRDTTVFEL